jgi:hypothetical protein
MNLLSSQQSLDAVGHRAVSAASGHGLMCPQEVAYLVYRIGEQVFWFSPGINSIAVSPERAVQEIDSRGDVSAPAYHLCTPIVHATCLASAYNSDVCKQRLGVLS